MAKIIKKKTTTNRKQQQQLITSAIVGTNQHGRNLGLPPGLSHYH